MVTVVTAPVMLEACSEASEMIEEMAEVTLLLMAEVTEATADSPADWKASKQTSSAAVPRTTADEGQ